MEHKETIFPPFSTSFPLTPQKTNQLTSDVDVSCRVDNALTRLGRCEKELQQRWRRLTAHGPASLIKKSPFIFSNANPMDEKPFSSFYDACSRLLEYSLALELSSESENGDESPSGLCGCNRLLNDDLLPFPHKKSNAQKSVIFLSSVAALMKQAVQPSDGQLEWKAAKISLSFRFSKILLEDIKRLKMELKTLEMKNYHLKSVLNDLDQHKWSNHPTPDTVGTLSSLLPHDKIIPPGYGMFPHLRRFPEPLSSVFASARSYPMNAASLPSYSHPASSSSTGFPLPSGFVIFPNAVTSNLKHPMQNLNSLEYSDHKLLKDRLPSTSFFPQQPLPFFHCTTNAETHPFGSTPYLSNQGVREDFENQLNQLGYTTRQAEMPNKTCEGVPGKKKLEEFSRGNSGQHSAQDVLQPKGSQNESFWLQGQMAQQKNVHWSHEDSQHSQQRNVNRSNEILNSQQLPTSQQDCALQTGLPSFYKNEPHSGSDNFQFHPPNNLQSPQVSQPKEQYVSQLQTSDIKTQSPMETRVNRYPPTDVLRTLSRPSRPLGSSGYTLSTAQTSAPGTNSHTGWTTLVPGHGVCSTTSPPEKRQQLQGQMSSYQRPLQEVQSPRKQLHNVVHLQNCQYRSIIPQNSYCQKMPPQSHSTSRHQLEQKAPDGKALNQLTEEGSRQLYKVQQASQPSGERQELNCSPVAFQQDAQTKCFTPVNNAYETCHYPMHFNENKEQTSQKNLPATCQWRPTSLVLSHHSPENSQITSPGVDVLHSFKGPPSEMINSLDVSQRSPTRSMEPYQAPKQCRIVTFRPHNPSNPKVMFDDAFPPQQLHDPSQSSVQNFNEMLHLSRQGMMPFANNLAYIQQPFDQLSEERLQNKFSSEDAALQDSRQPLQQPVLLHQKPSQSSPNLFSQHHLVGQQFRN